MNNDNDKQCYKTELTPGYVNLMETLFNLDLLVTKQNPLMNFLMYCALLSLAPMFWWLILCFVDYNEKPLS